MRKDSCHSQPNTNRIPNRGENPDKIHKKYIDNSAVADYGGLFF